MFDNYFDNFIVLMVTEIQMSVLKFCSGGDLFHTVYLMEHYSKNLV